MIDFVCVGGNKCGTTWLYEMLRQHPQLNVAINKEPHYFSRNYHRGEEWYQKNWGREDGLRGEFSTSYLYSEEAIGRLVEDCPEVRIIIMLRHPVERAVSHLRHVMRTGKYANYGHALDEHPEVVGNSLYANCVQQVEAVFGAERVLVCFFDDVKNAPEGLVRHIFSFLEVDPAFVPERLNTVVGKGYRPRFPYLERLRLGLYRFMKRNGLYTLIQLVKKTGVTKAYKQLNSSSDGGAELEQLFHQHRSSFCTDIRKLLQLSCVHDSSHAERWLSSLCGREHETS